MTLNNNINIKISLLENNISKNKYILKNYMKILY